MRKGAGYLRRQRYGDDAVVCFLFWAPVHIYIFQDTHTRVAGVRRTVLEKPMTADTEGIVGQRPDSMW
jgi:hypothetical protein